MGGDHRERAVCRQGAAGAKRKRMKKAWSKNEDRAACAARSLYLKPYVRNYEFGPASKRTLSTNSDAFLRRAAI